MPQFDSSTSVLAGMPTATVQAALSNAQAAYTQLATGAKVVTVSYAQGDGSRSVSYRQTDLGELITFIRLCQAQLGIICAPRRPIRVAF